MECKVGDIIKDKGKKYMCVPGIDLCLGCAFLEGGCATKSKKFGRCGAKFRENKDNVIFVEIKED